MQNRIEWGDEASPGGQENGEISQDGRMEFGEPEIWATIDPLTTRQDGTIICPVCRLAIEEGDSDIYVCSTCQTKYHRICWTDTLNQQCSFHN